MHIIGGQAHCAADARRKFVVPRRVHHKNSAQHGAHVVRRAVAAAALDDALPDVHLDWVAHAIDAVQGEHPA